MYPSFMGQTAPPASGYRLRTFAVVVGVVLLVDGLENM